MTLPPLQGFGFLRSFRSPDSRPGLLPSAPYAAANVETSLGFSVPTSLCPCVPSSLCPLSHPGVSRQAGTKRRRDGSDPSLCPYWLGWCLYSSGAVRRIRRESIQPALHPFYHHLRHADLLEQVPSFCPKILCGNEITAHLVDQTEVGILTGHVFQPAELLFDLQRLAAQVVGVVQVPARPVDQTEVAADCGLGLVSFVAQFQGAFVENHGIARWENAPRATKLPRPEPVK